MGEYNKAKSIVQNELHNASTGYNMNIQGPIETEREKLEMISKSLGIESLNKSDEELRGLIASKMGGNERDRKNHNDSGTPQQS